MMLLRRSAARAGDAARRSAARVYARGLASKDDSGPDMDAIMRERKIILSRFGGSKIADAVRADRDKKFEAKAVLLAVDDDAPEEERAFKMPDLEMDHLFEDRTESILGLASKHTATLVTIGMTQHARKQLAAVHEAFLDTYRLDSVSPADKVPGVGLVDCSYANGWAFAALRFVMMPGVRAAVPENMHPYAYSRFESSERATEVRPPAEPDACSRCARGPRPRSGHRPSSREVASWPCQRTHAREAGGTRRA